MEDQKEFGETSESIRTALTAYVPTTSGQVFPVPPDESVVRAIVDRCRKQAPDATEAEIIHFINEQGALAKRREIPNPIAYLSTTVPDCFKAETLSQYRSREKLAEKAKDEAKKRWICAKCNIVVDSPLMSDKKKRTCQLGHDVEKPGPFLAGLIVTVVMLVVAAMATHAVGWIWDLPARLLNAFTVGMGITFGTITFLIKGIRNMVKGDPARRLAPGLFGMALGCAFVFILVMHPLTSVPSGTTANLLYLTPDMPYYSDSAWERVYRFFLPYGMMFGNYGMEPHETASVSSDRDRADLAAPAAVSGPEYSATAIFHSLVSGADTRAKISVRGSQIRFDPIDATQKDPFYFIIDREKQTIVVVDPAQRVYAKQSTSTATEPFASFYRMEEMIFNGTNPCVEFPAASGCKRIGNDVLSGRPAAKWEILQAVNGRTLTGYAWVDSRLGAIVKSETPGGSIELQDIHEGPQPASLFSIPSSYKAQGR